MSQQEHEFVHKGAESLRLDHFLTAQLPGHSRSFLQGLIKKGMVWIDGEITTKSGKLIEQDQVVVVHVPPALPSKLIPENIPLDIIYEDKNVIVVNKPAGMVVHPAVGNQTGTLVQAVLGHVPGIEGVGGEQRPGLVHRLDKNTSGLIILAKNDRSHQLLQKQFAARQVEKTYLALVDGHPPTPEGRVETYIGRDARHRQKMAVVSEAKGRGAVSEYLVLENFKRHALVQVRILTGRTHQIRVHMAFIECPIVGDRVYGRRNPNLPADRQMLHAAKLKITLPGIKIPKTFEADIPSDMQAILDLIKT